jgi:hypothetical protein
MFTVHGLAKRSNFMLHGLAVEIASSGPQSLAEPTNFRELDLVESLA